MPASVRSVEVPGYSAVNGPTHGNAESSLHAHTSWPALRSVQWDLATAEPLPKAADPSLGHLATTCKPFMPQK